MTYREAFDRFWALYPKQLFILEAQTAFVAALKAGASLNEIMAGLQRYREHLVGAGTEFQYIKTAKTWLEKGCWADRFEANLPKVSSTSGGQPWAARYAGWKGRGFWLDQWGPAPDQPETQCPRELMIREVG